MKVSDQHHSLTALPPEKNLSSHSVGSWVVTRAGIRTTNHQAPSLIAVPTTLNTKVLRNLETSVTFRLSTLSNIP